MTLQESKHKKVEASFQVDDVPFGRVDSSKLLPSSKMIPTFCQRTTDDWRACRKTLTEEKIESSEFSFEEKKHQDKVLEGKRMPHVTPNLSSLLSHDPSLPPPILKGKPRMCIPVKFLDGNEVGGDSYYKLIHAPGVIDGHTKLVLQPDKTEEECANPSDVWDVVLELMVSADAVLDPVVEAGLKGVDVYHPRWIVLNRISAREPTPVQESVIQDRLTRTEQMLWLPMSQRSHGFFSACFESFAHHFPLELDPNHLLQVVHEGWIQHLEQNAEELRHKLVQHEGKKKIEINRDSFIKGDPLNDWPGAFDEFCQQVRAHTSEDLYRTVTGDLFSTSTRVDQIARNISLMSSTKNYFEFSCNTCCGFPKITLKGTWDDWRLLKIKVFQLKPYMTEKFAASWMPVLEEIIDQFIDAYQGKVNKLFWSSMVKYYSTHGSGASTYITGWINGLFPFLKGRENYLCLSWKDLQALIAKNGGVEKTRGSDISTFGKVFSSAPVIWNYYSEKFQLKFKTGFIGATQDPLSGTITPRVSWAVVEEVPSKAALDAREQCSCVKCAAAYREKLQLTKV